MKKWQKVTIWVASILIVLVVGGLFAANYAVDKVLDSMVGMSLDDLLEEDDNAVVGEETNGGASQNPDGADTATPDASAGQDAGNASTDQTAGNEQQGSSNTEGQDPNSSTSNNNQQGSSDKPTASTKPEGNKSDSGYTAEISTDKAKEVQDNITVAEKAKVVTTLMSSLSASDISTLQKLASGGLNVEEKKEAKALLLEKLSEDQYDELIAIAAKHGLSQGKTYSETKK